MRTQVGIIGAGPAGLFLALLLARDGIDCIVLEARSREYVEGRVRAGVLEQGTVDLMHELGVAERLMRESMIDRNLDIRFEGQLIHLDLPGLAGGREGHIYGQQEVVKDLIAARLSAGPLLFEAEALAIDGIDTARPVINFRHKGEQHALECDVVAGCDGFHGIARASVPQDALAVHDHIFPFGWLGILSESRPLVDMTYAPHDRPPTVVLSEVTRATDVGVLPRRLTAFLRRGDDRLLEGYSDTCLRRVWKTVRYSTYMTTLLHRFPAHCT